jgi:hypothetical protein
MDRTPTDQASASAAPPLARYHRPIVSLCAGILLTYLAAAYLIVPAGWKRYVRHHPKMEDVPGITYTGSRIPGDPVNVSLIGTKVEVIRALLAAKWYPADPLSLRSCLEIAEATVLKRSYDDAPVSSLYLWGRKEDPAFEQLVDRNPRKRHHVRFWRAPKDDPDGRPVWVGAAIYDDRVGISHRTGQITHHTGPDIDAERDLLFRDLQGTGDVAEVYTVPDFHTIHQGRNGGGDPWHTDGSLYVAVLKPLIAEPASGGGRP